VAKRRRRTVTALVRALDSHLTRESICSDTVRDLAVHYTRLFIAARFKAGYSIEQVSDSLPSVNVEGSLRMALRGERQTFKNW
jgi:hypothetical protein